MKDRKSQAKRDKLLKRARTNPASLTFAELTRLAEDYGFVLWRISGDHHVYKRAGFPRGLVIQPKGTMAKEYQVRQLLDMIETIERLEEPGDTEENDA